VFSSSGGFDEDFCGRHEDWELGIRLLEQGVPFAYYPHAAAWHRPRIGLDVSMRSQREEAVADVLIARKHRSVRARLPLAGVAMAVRAGSTARPLAYRRPLAADVVWRLGPGTAQLLEACGMRSAWNRYLRRLMRHAYSLGLRDAVPSFAGLADLAPDPVLEFPLELNGRGVPLADIPASAGVEFRLELGGTFLARFAPLPSHAQWDSREIAAAAAQTLVLEAELDSQVAAAFRPEHAASELGGV
jgi:hypothetical protein